MAPDPRLTAWRLAIITVSVILLFWLPFEDVHDRFVQVFSLVYCILGALRWLLTRTARGIQRRLRPGWVGVLFLVLTGLSFGLLVAPGSVFLMALKSGLHGHPVPDFSLDQIRVVWQNAPLWGVIGSLVGLAAGLLRLAQMR